MDWLNDRKNLPLVASLCVVVVLGAVVYILWSQGYLARIMQGSIPASQFEEQGNNRFLPQAVPTATTPKPAVKVASGLKKGVKKPLAVKPPIKMASVPKPAAAVPPVVRPAALVSNPPAPVKPKVAVVAPPAAAKPAGAKPASGTKVAAKPPLEPPLTTQSVLKGKDPFYVEQPAKPVVVASAPRLSVPELNIYRYTPRPASSASDTAPSGAPSDQLAGGRRVSGIMYSNGVYALLESNGQTYTVQPGDQVEGDRVVSIQSDGLILRTINNVLIHVPLSGGSDAGVSSQGGGGASPAPQARRGPPPGASF